jgi:adenine-specific DNA-methyltransferase
MLFDLTVTSPPYNIGKEYESVMDHKAYLTWCEQWLQQIYFLTNPSGALWLNLGFFAVPNVGQCVPISYLLWDKVPFFLIQEVVWNYGAGKIKRKEILLKNFF